MQVKNLFLFGAGASNGCNGTNEIVPLGIDLFTNLKNKFPGTWGTLPPAFESDFKDKFEKGMSRLWSDLSYNDKISFFMKDIAIFFSKFKITDFKQNLYYKLFRELKKKDALKETVLSTINYDCLIEFALEKLNVNYSYVTTSINNTIIVLKIHGSCNYILDPKVISVRSGAKYRPGITFNPPLIFKSPEDIEEYCYSDTALYPAMAIYMSSKPIQMGSVAIKEMQEDWQEIITKAKKVFIIGVNPNLEDKHIWDYVDKKDRVFYCGSKDRFDEWQQNKNRKDIFLNYTFESAIQNIIKYSLN